MIIFNQIHLCCCFAERVFSELGGADRASDWLRHTRNTARLRGVLHARQVEVSRGHQAHGQLLDKSTILKPNGPFFFILSYSCSHLF